LLGGGAALFFDVGGSRGVCGAFTGQRGLGQAQGLHAQQAASRLRHTAAGGAMWSYI